MVLGIRQAASTARDDCIGLTDRGIEVASVLLQLIWGQAFQMGEAAKAK